MEDKIINFHIYRYHLLPIDHKSRQQVLFEGHSIDTEKLKERKNEYFGTVLDGLLESKNNANPLKLEHQEDNYYLFKLAQKKTTIVTKNFEDQVIDNEPYVYIVFNNDPLVQKIAISENADAFSKPEVVKNILKKVFIKDLERFGLNIEIDALFDKVEFWKYVKLHKNQITLINFEFIKPNLANISKTLPKAFKAFTNETNSHDSNIILKAPTKGHLTNINKRNEDIKGLVDYVSEGAGSIKLKAKGERKYLNTKENPVTMQIKEATIQGTVEQIIKLYKNLVE